MEIVMKILVIDDKKSNIDQAVLELTEAGHEVIVPKILEGCGVAMSVGHALFTGHYDLMIIDLMMPEDPIGVHEEFQTGAEHPYGLLFALYAAQQGTAGEIVVYSAGDRHNGAMPYDYSRISSSVDNTDRGSKKSLMMGKTKVHFLSTWKDPKNYTAVLAYLDEVKTV